MLVTAVCALAGLKGLVLSALGLQEAAPPAAPAVGKRRATRSTGAPSGSSGPDAEVEAAVRNGLCPERLERVTQYLECIVADDKVAGCSAAVMRNGELCYAHCAGLRDAEAGLPMEMDTIVRIYSMTKPIVTVAAMMLYEEGHFQLDTPVHRFLPCFRDMQVVTDTLYNTEPAKEAITIKHLMTHTSGLTYGFLPDGHGLHEAYKAAGVGFTAIETPALAGSLQAACETLAAMPLLFHPGSSWAYGNSTDVLGRVVEVVSGQTLAEFVRTRILEPLGMPDTGFVLPREAAARFARCYMHVDLRGGPRPDDHGRRYFHWDAAAESYFEAPPMFSGGGGLAGTIPDYLRFCQMVLNGGTLDGHRLLAPGTVAFMCQNHLDGDIRDMLGGRTFLNLDYSGIGFGLGFSVVTNPARKGTVMSQGECAWGGYASTCFWIDPKENLVCVFFTQLIPSSAYPFRFDLRCLVNQAIVE